MFIWDHLEIEQEACHEHANSQEQNKKWWVNHHFIVLEIETGHVEALTNELFLQINVFIKKKLPV